MNLSYYAKKRLTDLSVNIVMLILLFFTLLPIVWMVYLSLKDSTDIAIGKVGLRQAGREILEIVPDGEGVIALSADGGLTRFKTADLSRLAQATYKTSATSYLVKKDYIWIASTNRGLLRVARNDFNSVSRADFSSSRIDAGKVTTTYIKQVGGFVFVSLDYKRFADVWKFDAKTLKLVGVLSQAKQKYFPKAGSYRLVSSNLKIKDQSGEIFSKARIGSDVFVGTSTGWVYKYSPNQTRVVAKARVPHGHLLVRFSNYVDMWKNVNFGLYLRNSIIICGITMIIAMTFATFAAYSLSRFRFPGSDLFSNAILATQMIPMIMYLIPIYIMFVKFTVLTNIPVKGTFPGIILIYSAWFLPFSIWILRSFFAAIPRELEEAALIDGCSRFRVFWHVALPLAMPGIIATGIYVFLNAWDELMFAWVLTNSDTMTIPVGIRLFVGNYQNRFDLMMAAATVATLPVVVIFFLLQKHIVKGLTAGAVKG